MKKENRGSFTEKKRSEGKNGNDRRNWKADEDVKLSGSKIRPDSKSGKWKANESVKPSGSKTRPDSKSGKWKADESAKPSGSKNRLDSKSGKWNENEDVKLAGSKNCKWNENRSKNKKGKKPDGRGQSGDTGTERLSTPAYFCPVGKKCGGCHYLNLPYEKQLHLKQKRVAELLKPFCKVYPITGMEQPLHYRNKVHAVFDRTREGKVVSGIYQEGTHTVVPVKSCLIENEKADAIINDIRGLLRSFKIKTYDEDTGYGLLRHVLIRMGHTTGQIMVVLVLGSPVLPSKNNFVKALRALHPEITTVVLNVNDKKTSMVLGEKESVIYGKGYIEDELCGCRFRISSKSFYQVNSVQTEKLYRKAIDLADLTGKERVIDAYCGIGTIGIIASAKAGEVIGVELNKDAVRDAVKNAGQNQVKNISFYQNDAGVFMIGMAEQRESADVVFMDPPRSGSDEAFMSSVVKLSPRRVVYISCNPETLARDLNYFTTHGYRAEGAWPYDMFPLTEEIETVVLLSRK